MSNTHGHLPKAERDHLSMELQQRLGGVDAQGLYG